ncbi:MAG: tetratricopeptide repeat protein [Cyanobacteria bacterium J06639_1]
MQQVALHLIQQQRFPEARSLLQQQLDREPTNTLLLSQMGFVLVRLGDRAAAVETLRQAVAIAPNDPRLLANLANALRESGDKKEAASLYARAAELSGDRPEILLNLAVSHLERRDYETALAVATRGLQQAPQEDRLHFIAAQSLQNLQRPAEAIAHYEAAIERQPQQRQLVLGLSAALVSCGRLPEAKTLLEAFLEQHPFDPEAISNAAAVYFELGWLREAEVAYRAAVRLAPDRFVSHYNLSAFLKQCDRFEDARASLKAAFEIVADAPEALLLDADLAIGLGQLRKADDRLARVLMRSPDRIEPLVKRAQVRRALGDLSMSNELLTRAQIENPRAPALLAMLAARDRQELANFFDNEADCGAFEPARVVRLEQLAVGPELRQQAIAAVRAHPTLVANRPNKPTTGGSQSHELFGNEVDSLFTALGQRLLERALAYLDAIAERDRRYIELPRSPDFIQLSGWGVVLAGGGYQKPHTHPESVVSGVLYLQIPPSCREGDRGNLRFSPQRSEQPGDRSTHFDISPKTDDLVFFPSYLWHGTVPFDGSEERICIAFNVTPSLARH